jgi:hypothetical protein
LRFTIPVVALALILVSLSARPAHAGPGAVGWLGYGHVFQEGDDQALGPTLEVGGSFSALVAAVDVTYWNDLDEAGDSSQLRLGGRLAPPIIPLYARLAIGYPFDGTVRDNFGWDLVVGAGLEVLSLPLVSFNIGLDYHYWTDGVDVHPIEAKAGLVIGF